MKKIHCIAKDNSGDDVCFILMGAKQHPEVVSIMSYVSGEGHVFSSVREVEQALQNNELCELHKKRLVIAAQTTFNLVEWEKTVT